MNTFTKTLRARDGSTAPPLLALIRFKASFANVFGKVLVKAFVKEVVKLLVIYTKYTKNYKI